MNYAEWSERYATLFGLASDAGLEMLREIRNLCERHGYTVEELNEATDWIALNNPPKFLNEHVAAFQTALRELRAKKVLHPIAVAPWPEEDRGVCSLCSDGGMVSVPCPRHLALGKWGTAAVLCSCAAGRVAGDRQGGGLANGEPRPPMLTLGQYEMLYPDWKERLRRHEEEQQREATPPGKNMATALIVRNVLDEQKRKGADIKDLEGTVQRIMARIEQSQRKR